MTFRTDYRLHHLGAWQQSEAPKLDDIIYVVEYDGRRNAYIIPRNQYVQFLEWVAERWGGDNKPEPEDGEAVGHYLNRIGVTVRAMRMY